ncbi:MAG: NYN domain-containing protein [Acidimicrobiia bacterium]
MSESVLPVPEHLLAPLLDTAADLLRHLEQNDVPTSLRRVASFDRRGLARGIARHQVLAAIESDEEFRKVVCERFLEREEVAVALRSWDTSSAVARAEAAAERNDLPLLTSALFAGRPRGFSFGLGVAVAMFEARRRERAEADDLKAMHTQVAAADEARRRADHARIATEAQLQKIEAELKEERRGRRSREEAAQAEIEAARRETNDLRASLEKAERAIAALEDRNGREVERARHAETELRTLRDDLTQVRGELEVARAALANMPTAGGGLRAADLEALANAAALAQRLADGLSGVVDHARNKGLLESVATSAKTTAPRTEQPAANAASLASRGSAPEASRGSAPEASRGSAPEASRSATPTTPTAPALRPSARRTPVAVPPGMLADAPEAVDAMLRTPNVVLLVDGYNVSMERWSELGKAEQRDRLIAALSALHLRTKCEITVIFDGADVGAVRAPRSPGVRVRFSDAGTEADDVIVEELAALPPTTPTLVVSSDGWVRTEVERTGARAIPAHALIRVLR